MCWLLLLSASCTLMHIVEGLRVCLSVFLPSHLSVSFSRLAPFELCHSCSGSQACAVNAIVLRRGVPFCGIASSLPLFSHFLCDEALQWMNNIPLERGSLLLSGSAPTLAKAKSCSEMLSSHHGKTTERKVERKWGREGGTERILQNYLLFARGCVVTHFNNVSFLPGCAQLSADTCSGRREWERIQFCTWAVSKQVNRKLWIFTDFANVRH